MKAHLLLVDDQMDLLSQLETDLNDQYQVTKARNGQEAWLFLQQELVDLVISDISMPVMDGIQLCSLIKQDITLAHIPVILLTARNTVESKVLGLQSGADTYMEKPFSKEHLEAQINSLLRNRQHMKTFLLKNSSAQIPLNGIKQQDIDFLSKVEEIIIQNLQDTKFNVDQMADILCISRPTLYRRISAVSSLSPNELIHLTRLRKAAELLRLKQYKIYEVSNLLGYNSPSHFTRNFQKQFGVCPSEFQLNNQSKMN